MSATITTQHHHRMPLIASLSVAGVIAAAGAVGVVWHESSSSTSQNQAPAPPAPTAQPFGGLDGHVPPAPPPVMGGSHVHGQVPPAPPIASGGRLQRGE